MRVVIPQIAWHARDPVLTLDFDPKGKTAEGYYRLATGGADRLLLIWHLSNPTNLKPDIICVSELTRHQKGINVCRFSPCGNYIASGDDDSYVFIWKNESISEKEEVWNVEKIFRRHVEDVSDLCWSPDSNYLVSGSVDNTAVLWDVKKGTPIHFWSEREHTGFVQGVAYDPLGEFSATMCIDRNLRFFSNKNGKIMSKTLKYPGAWLGYSEDDDPKENAPGTAQLSLTENTSKQDTDASKELNAESNVNTEKDEIGKPMDSTSTTSSLPSSQNSSDLPSEISEQSTPTTVSEDIRDKPLSEINGEEQLPFKLPPKKPATTLNRLFHDDSLKTFCRRLSCSPRGELMIVPGGLLPPVEKGVEGETSRQSTPVDGEDVEPKEKEKTTKKFDPEQNNAIIIFCRNSWSNPCAVIPTGASYSIAAKFNPVYYDRERQAYEYDPELVNSNKRNERTISCVGKLRAPRTEEKVLLNMPYRLVYAVANNDSLLIGDTASAEPLACIRNIHCTRMTDISWSPDGLVLIASSTDGFCSILTFEEGELGAEFKVKGEEFPALTPNCFSIAAPEPKPVKKKEPKEPKEVKEKKELNEKKEKVKEIKEKKEKKEKVKEAPSTAENQEDKKKKTLTIPVMLATAKSSPSTVSTRTPQEKLKLGDSDLSPSTNSTAAPISENTTPKRAGTILNFFKKTPKSANSENKTPRRIQLITLTNSGDSDKLKPSTTNLDSVAPSAETSTNETPGASPKPVQEKQPRKIELVTKVTSESSPKSAPEKQPRRIELVTKVTCESSPKSAPEKQPRRIELVPKVTSESSPKSAPEKQPMRIELVTKVASKTSPTPASTERQPRRVELVTLDNKEPATKRRGVEDATGLETNKGTSEPSHKPAAEKQPRRIELVTKVTSKTSPKPAPVKQPRRVELVTLEENEPKTKRRAVEDAVIENQPVVECNQSVN